MVAPKPHVLYCSDASKCRHGMPSVVWMRVLDGSVLVHRGFLSEWFQALGTGCGPLGKRNRVLMLLGDRVQA